jgi:hypothetical protein
MRRAGPGGRGGNVAEPELIVGTPAGYRPGVKSGLRFVGANDAHALGRTALR